LAASALLVVATLVPPQGRCEEQATTQQMAQIVAALPESAFQVDMGQVEREVCRLLVEYSDEPGSLLHYMTLFADWHFYEASMVVGRDLLLRFPDDTDWALRVTPHMAHALLMLGQPEVAVRFMEALTARHPTNQLMTMDLHRLRTKVAMRSGDILEAARRRDETAKTYRRLVLAGWQEEKACYGQIALEWVRAGDLYRLAGDSATARANYKDVLSYIAEHPLPPDSQPAGRHYNAFRRESYAGWGASLPRLIRQCDEDLRRSSAGASVLRREVDYPLELAQLLGDPTNQAFELAARHARKALSVLQNATQLLDALPAESRQHYQELLSDRIPQIEFEALRALYAQLYQRAFVCEWAERWQAAIQTLQRLRDMGEVISHPKAPEGARAAWAFAHQFAFPIRIARAYGALGEERARQEWGERVRSYWEADQRRLESLSGRQKMQIKAFLKDGTIPEFRPDGPPERGDAAGGGTPATSVPAAPAPAPAPAGPG